MLLCCIAQQTGLDPAWCVSREGSAAHLVLWSGQMSVYTEFLDHVRASEPRHEPGRANENQTSGDHLVAGLLMRAAICLVFIGTGAVIALV
jgi:hypothetical protein